MNKKSLTRLSLIVLILFLTTIACSFVTKAFIDEPPSPSFSSYKTDVPTKTDTPENKNNTLTEEDKGDEDGISVIEESNSTSVPPSKTENTLTPEEVDELFAAFWDAWEIIHKKYVDQPVNDEALMNGAIKGMLDVLEEQYTDDEETPQDDDSTPIPPPKVENTLTPEEIDEMFATFWDAWENIHDEYAEQSIDNEALMRGAIRGMLESLGDQHTEYLDPQQYEDATANLQGEYEGIGAWVGLDSEYLTINEPMPGSPAEKAGLKPGDQVIGIDGEDMTGVAPEAARLKVLGPKNSIVILTIKRQGVEEPFDVEIQRARIIVPSVKSEMLENDIAYVRLYTFGDKTTKELKEALEELMDQNPKGLIIDLRNNGGGYLVTAVEVTSEFISEDKVVLYEEYNDQPRETFETLDNGLAIDIPLVVLINEYSASASEIVAGAIQDHERGLLVGEKSFGKGSVQQWIPLIDNQGAVKVTTARWLTPNGRHIHGAGLTPDVVVKRDEETATTEDDPQLDKAIELLKN